jgi:hypothetical protein
LISSHDSFNEQKKFAAIKAIQQNRSELRQSHPADGLSFISPLAIYHRDRWISALAGMTTSLVTRFLQT